ncbi:MAG: lipopolysaccharide kinase InaA family protein [Planctomycetota bacterium]|jgi:heptose I phosphotransferase
MTAPFERRGDLLLCPDEAGPLRRAELDAFDALMQAGGPRLEKAGLPHWRERVVLELEGRTFFLKRYRRPPWGEQLRRALHGRRSTADAEWSWLRRLAELGVPAPRPVAFGARCRAGVEQASLLLTAAVPGESLERWAARGRTGPLADADVRDRLSRALGRLVAGLHGAGLVHRDLYLSHVFMAIEGDGVRLTFIDVQRIKRLGLRRRRWLVKDLAALQYSTPPEVASAAERLRWYLRDYRGIGRLTAADRRIVRAIVAKTRRIARHSAKHGL